MKMRNGHLKSLRSLPKSIQLGQIKLSALKRPALMAVYRKLFLQVGVMWHCKSRTPSTEEEETCKPPSRLCPSQPMTFGMCLP